MTDILDVVDLDLIEEGLRSGDFTSLEQYYDHIRRVVGRDLARSETDMLRSSLFPAERDILLSLPQSVSRAAALEMDVDLPLGTYCKTGKHLRKTARDFFIRRGRPVCRACELERTARNKRDARARAAAERAENPTPRKKVEPGLQAGRPRRRLTAADVLDIRAAYRENGERFGWLSRTAEAYGVKHTTIHDVITRRTWKDV